MIADPYCTVCGAKKTWIGIGPGAVAECLRCDHGLCPSCKDKLDVLRAYRSEIFGEYRANLWCRRCRVGTQIAWEQEDGE